MQMLHRSTNVYIPRIYTCTCPRVTEVATMQTFQFVLAEILLGRWKSAIIVRREIVRSNHNEYSFLRLQRYKS